MTDTAQYSVGDTYPSLRGLAADRAGPLDLTSADAVNVILSSDRTVISGPAVVLDPPEDVDGNPFDPDADPPVDGPFNWRYDFAETDLAIAGVYVVQLEIVEDELAEPPLRRTLPVESVDRLLVGVGQWHPTVDQVASQWLRARTYLGLDVPAGATAGGDAGTFTAETSPTRAEAEAAIEGAIQKVLSHFPREIIPPRSYGAAQHAATIYAALEIELGYFPEQSAADSAFLQLRGLSEAATITLVNGAQMNDLFGENVIYLDGMTVAVGLADEV
jgi:hypothetical protein